MLRLLISVALLATSLAATIGSDDLYKQMLRATMENKTVAEFKPVIQILQNEAQKDVNGSFYFAYEGSDGSSRQEIGLVKNAGTDEEILEVQGSYRYIDADNQLVEVKYTAGKDGFVPESNIIPEELTLAARAAGEMARKQDEVERNENRKRKDMKLSK